LEAARWIDWLKPGGTVFVNRQKIVPMSVSIGKAIYPAQDDILAAIGARTDDVILIEGLAIAKQLGKAQLGNTVLLGAISTRLDVDQETWVKVIKRRVPPKYVEMNRAAFSQGRLEVVKS
jgi:indolepyruvate ferredoxin oxidoreductase beta subunit